MLESAARTKWCPFARVGSVDSGVGSLNRDWRAGPHVEAACIGSACMAWIAGEVQAAVHEKAVDDWLALGWTILGPKDKFGLVLITRPANGDCGLKR